ncbi:MAG: phosphatidylglycerol lysyltransferase domain-containing protein [Peptococcaceae bacterium]|jgi:hypothetical protein|nr:phosphatidylglycerol lysyltransferase domain-containing protein [Peptococcaceae bacterium]
MTSFKALTLEDKELFCRYLGDYAFHTYEYSFLSLYLWKDYAQAQWALIDGALVIKKAEENKGAYFMQPIGYAAASLPKLIEELRRLAQDDPEYKYLFRDVEEPFLTDLEAVYGEKVQSAEDPKYFDYIYEAEKMIQLSGEKLGKRRNQVHQFLRAYEFEIKDIRASGVAQDCLRFSQEWLAQQKEPRRELLCELEGIGHIFAHLDQLSALGMAVYVQGRVVGFTFGEKVNRQMAIIHVEKGDTAYKGVYAFLNKTFAERYLSDVRWINREEDLGLARLKKAKEAYDPLRLEKKYKINIGW